MTDFPPNATDAERRAILIRLLTSIPIEYQTASTLELTVDRGTRDIHPKYVLTPEDWSTFLELLATLDTLTALHSAYVYLTEGDHDAPADHAYFAWTALTRDIVFGYPGSHYSTLRYKWLEGGATWLQRRITLVNARKSSKVTAANIDNNNPRATTWEARRIVINKNDMATVLKSRLIGAVRDRAAFEKRRQTQRERLLVQYPPGPVEHESTPQQPTDTDWIPSMPGAD